TMHLTKLGNPNWKFPITMRFIFIDHHMMWTVHRTKDKHFTVSHIHWRKHVFMIMIPMTGFFVKFNVGHDGGINMLITETDFFVYNVAFNRTANRCTLWKPKWKPLSYFRI